MLEKIDIHCHIIPGVDDGASSREEVERLLRREYESGVRTIVLTPHHRKGMFEESREKIIQRANYVRKLAERMDLDMKIYLGCEYCANSRMIEDLKREAIYRINGGRYVLVEFTNNHSYQQIRNWIYELKNEGFCPIIAHIERYTWIAKNEKQMEDLCLLGALLQMDAGSLLGKYGYRIKRIAKHLLEKDYIDIIASDAHDSKQYCPDLDRCERYVTRKLGKEKALELFYENPRRVIEYNK